MDENKIVRRLDKIAELEAQKAELEEAIKNHRAALAEVLPMGDTEVGDYRVVKTLTTRFDDGLARKVLTAQEYDSIAVQKADSKKAAALLTEAQMNACKKTYGSQIRIGRRD